MFYFLQSNINKEIVLQIYTKIKAIAFACYLYHVIIELVEREKKN